MNDKTVPVFYHDRDSTIHQWYLILADRELSGPERKEAIKSGRYQDTVRLFDELVIVIALDTIGDSLSEVFE